MRGRGAEEVFQRSFRGETRPVGALAHLLSQGWRRGCVGHGIGELTGKFWGRVFVGDVFPPLGFRKIDEVLRSRPARCAGGGVAAGGEIEGTSRAE